MHIIILAVGTLSTTDCGKGKNRRTRQHSVIPNKTEQGGSGEESSGTQIKVQIPQYAITEAYLLF